MTNVLHLVGGHHALGDCLNRVGSCDSILLMHKDLITQQNRARLTEASNAGLSLYLLDENMDTINPSEKDQGLCLQCVDYHGFVILTERHATTVTWP